MEENVDILIENMDDMRDYFVAEVVAFMRASL